MKKFLLVVALFTSMSVFAQTPLHKMTKVNFKNQNGVSLSKTTVKKLPTDVAKRSVKAQAADAGANYYLDYMDHPYNISSSGRYHVASNVDFGNDGKVTFSNMLYSSILPDAKITGTLNAAGDEITIDNGQSLGTAYDLNFVVCRVHVDTEGNLSIDQENPLVLSYDKETGQIMAKDPEDSYIALFDDTYDGFYALGYAFNYIPAEYFPEPTVHEYTYTDYDGTLHESTVSMINVNFGGQDVCYVKGLFTEVQEDNMGNVLADYSTAWTCAFSDESGLTFSTPQTLADDIAMAMMDSSNKLYAGNMVFSYDAASDSYVQDADYVLIDVYATQQGLGFSTAHGNGKIAKAGTSGIENTVNDGVNKDVVSTEYFDLSGRRISNIQKGAGIMVMKYADGTSKSVKVVK